MTHTITEELAAILSQPDALARLKAHFRAERDRSAAVLTNLQQQQKHLELVGLIAAHANESRSFLAALQFAVTRVCTSANWPVGHVYLCNGSVESSKIWHLDLDERFSRFCETTESFELDSGMDPIGDVLAHRRPLWISDISSEDNFLRRRPAAEAGLKSWIAAPVLVEQEVIAVLEFFSARSEPREGSLERSIAQIGTQLGRVRERERAEEALRSLALHDDLTGLPNRRLFLERLEHALRRQQRRTGLVAVMFIDLDRFKSVNDTLGHAAGDHLLRTAARRLMNCVRPGDTVARFGGDEFAVLLDDIQDDRTTTRIADRVQQVLASPIELEGRQIEVSASIGIASSHPHYAEASRVLCNADQAMYRAKSKGRARYEIYDARASDRILTPRTIEQDLYGALERSELRLEYQPIRSLISQKIIGLEALLRWHRQDGRVLLPGEFLPVAEKTRMILPIGRWAIAEAVHQLAELDRHLGPDHGLTMSLNFSSLQFAQPSFARDLGEILGHARMDPSRVRVEITETTLIERGDGSYEQIAALHDLGVQLDIDDFGVGESALVYLYKFPVDTLKIDRAFIARLQDRGESFEIVRTIMELARNLHLRVVAEGIETDAQLTALRELRCEYGQGFLLGRPMDVAELSAEWRATNGENRSDLF